MTELTPLFVGFIMGAAVVLCGFIVFFIRKPRVSVPDVWTEEYHQQPQASTRILISKREINLP